jgi:hypothetical protein
LHTSASLYFVVVGICADYIEDTDRKMTDQEWTNPSSTNTAPPSSSPLRLPATPPSASLFGTSHDSSSSYSRSGQYPQQNTHPLSPSHQRTLPPIPIQPYTTPPTRQNQPLPPIHTHSHGHSQHQFHPPPPNAPPTPGETPWDLRQIDVYRLDEESLRMKLVAAIHRIQSLTSTLSSTRTSIAQYTLQNHLLRTESREISQRSAVETELAKREVEVLLREYAAQMPSANQLANTYYRRYRGLKLRVKDLEALIEGKDADIKRLRELVQDSGITVPREGTKRTRRTGLKYAPRGGAWAGKTSKSLPNVPRTLKPAPTLQSTVTGKSDAGTSQGSQSSGLDALGMLASQVLDSQESRPSQQYFPSTQIPSTQYVPSTPLKPSKSSQTLLSPLPLPTKRRRGNSRASDSTVDHDPALTEPEISPTKMRVMNESDEEVEIKESPPSSQPISYANALPIPYRTTIMGGDLVPGGPRRKLNFDSNDSGLLGVNHGI